MMKRILAAMAWLLLLGLCGCPSDEECFPFDPFPATPTALLVVGEPVAMLLSPFENGGTCSPSGASPTDFSAEITGPDGQLVPNEASLNQPHSLNGTLRFTPKRPGRYHVFAAFDPVGGLQQFDLHAARDRSTETVPMNLSAACQTLERTDRGSWVCGSQVYPADQSFMTGLPEGRVAVAGNVVWVAGPQQIQRYVDTGTQLETTATLSHTEGTPGFLLASPDELLVLYAHSLQRITFDGTALVSTGFTAWADTPAPVYGSGLTGVLLRTGTGLALVGRAPASGGQGLQACAYQLEAGGLVRTGEPCQPLSGTLLGFERSVLWMGDPVFGDGRVETLRRMEWTGSRLETRGTLLVGPSLQVVPSASPGPTVVPILAGMPYEVRGLPIRAGVPVYLPEQDQLSIELLDKEIVAPQASSTLYWGSPGSGRGSRIRVRPPSP